MIWCALLFAAAWCGFIIALLGLVAYGLHTGRMPNRFETVVRYERPAMFWFLIAIYSAMAGGMIYCAYAVVTLPALGLI